MFERAYGLSGPPFRLTPSTDGFFRSKAHEKALSYLRYGLQQAEGFIVVTGEVGTGKSTVVNHLFAELDPARLDAGRIATTQVDEDSALRLVLAAFGLVPRAADKGGRLAELEAFLAGRRRLGRRVLLVVDEAQNLPTRTLEEIRMLSNLTGDGQPLLQTFLVGQPQFQRLLASPDMEQLRQRVIGWCHLEPLGREELGAYVRHRLSNVGWAGNPELTEPALDVVHRASRGVPRLVNQLCNRLLLLGALEGLSRLDSPQAQVVVDDLALESGMSLAATAEPAVLRPAKPLRLTIPEPAEAEIDQLRREVSQLRRHLDSHDRVLRHLLGLVGQAGAARNQEELHRA